VAVFGRLYGNIQASDEVLSEDFTAIWAKNEANVYSIIMDFSAKEILLFQYTEFCVGTGT
jgi:hypothetical protein